MTTATKPDVGWLDDAECSLPDFVASIDRTTDLADYPFAASVERNILRYKASDLHSTIGDAAKRRDVRSELVRALTNGPGIVVFEGAFDDSDILDDATTAFETLIADQRTNGQPVGDHFGRPGANDRIWNAAEKLAIAAPEVFAKYYANDVLALIAQAWLGPVYQVTSQINVVNPGSAAQVPHRDYHLGIVRDEHLLEYPRHLHRMSAALTLQGAVAHCDMPIESGPTMYLPYSQTFEPGYVAFKRDDFIAYFREHHVQLPLSRGDAVFFNPALYHGAGQNRSESTRRMANLLQLSSPFGRAMETVDREAMSNAVYPALLRLAELGTDERSLHNVVVATAECYPFPTNLDLDPPNAGALAPPTQIDLVWEALMRRDVPSVLAAALAAQTNRRKSS